MVELEYKMIIVQVLTSIMVVAVAAVQDLMQDPIQVLVVMVVVAMVVQVIMLRLLQLEQLILVAGLEVVQDIMSPRYQVVQV